MLPILIEFGLLAKGIESTVNPDHDHIRRFCFVKFVDDRPFDVASRSKHGKIGDIRWTSLDRELLRDP